MKGNNLPGWMRVLMIVCGLTLIAVIFVPIWRIDLDAPQYPEGLMMQIFADKVGGQVDIINGLNHYIGMKEIHNEDFIEFKVLPYIIGLFSFLFVLVGALNKKKFFYFVFTLFVLFGILAMYDFWRWEYDYGHNLNPKAAIIVPGMSYQPPLIGYKQLLNFAAYSFPDIGGWIFVGVGLISLLCFAYLIRIGRKMNKVAALVLISSLFVGLESCSSGPEPLVLGKDYCEFCKMTLTSKKYGAEIVTAKYKAIKFDDIKCMMDYIKIDSSIKINSKIFVSDYTGDNNLMPVNELIYLSSELLRTPMGGNIVGFSNVDSLKNIQSTFKGNSLTWAELQETMR